ncbi:MAG: dual specificity protein phosphatase family protein [Chryseolinea sp.]
MARPRGHDDLEFDIRRLKAEKVQLLVSLLEEDEVIDLGLEQEKNQCSNHGIVFISYPIKDRGVPDDEKNLNFLLDRLAMEIRKGCSIAIHCRMGIGRASIIAACLLVMDGQNVEEAFKTISNVRGLKVPDTEDQKIWLQEKQFNLLKLRNRIF